MIFKNSKKSCLIKNAPILYLRKKQDLSVFPKLKINKNETNRASLFFLPKHLYIFLFLINKNIVKVTCCERTSPMCDTTASSLCLSRSFCRNFKWYLRSCSKWGNNLWIMSRVWLSSCIIPLAKTWIEKMVKMF